MVEAPEKIWAAAKPYSVGIAYAVKPPEQYLVGYTEYLRSDIAERQIAELRAEVARLDSELNISQMHETIGIERFQAAEAENARLRALPLKDEVERVVDDAQIWISENVRSDDAVGNEVLCEVRALLSRLRAGEQQGWRLVPVEPSRGRLISMAIRDNHAFLINPDPNAKWTSGVKPEHRESILRSMRQLYDEAIGEGFYSPEKEQSYIDSLERSMPLPASPSVSEGGSLS